MLNPPGSAIRTGRLVRPSKISTQSWPPIALAYAGGVLEKLGYDVKVHDASILGESMVDTVPMILEWNPDSIAYYWSYDTCEDDLWLANELGKRFRVFLVGPWSAHYPKALEDCPSVEAMTVGQFEYTLPSLIEGKEAQGVTYQGGRHIYPREAYSQSELDWIPFVTDVYRRHLPIEKYHQTSFRHPFVDLYTSRGCVPGTCTFCSVNNGANKLNWQHRSLGNVMEELWSIKRTLPEVKQIFFQDDTLPTPWALKIADQIVAEKLDLCWGCYSRADKKYDEIMKMKEAGCRTYHVGYEFPEQEVLDLIDKRVTVEQMETFAAAVRKSGMWTSSSFMVFPFCTPEQMKHLIGWIKKTKATRVNVAALQVYPGCPISQTIEKMRIEGKPLMTWDEMVAWEKRCFMEFYVKNPEFWAQALMNPSEWRSLLRDSVGMLKFLSR